MLIFPEVSEKERAMVEFQDEKGLDKKTITLSDGSRVTKYPSDMNASLGFGYRLVDHLYLGAQAKIGAAFAHVGVYGQFDFYNWDSGKFGLGLMIGDSGASSDNFVWGAQALAAQEMISSSDFALTTYAALQGQHMRQRLNIVTSTSSRAADVAMDALLPVLGFSFDWSLKPKVFLAGFGFKLYAGWLEPLNIAVSAPEGSDYKYSSGPFAGFTLNAKF